MPILFSKIKIAYVMTVQYLNSLYDLYTYILVVLHACIISRSVVPAQKHVIIEGCN